MKKICASALSANGMERSKTRASEMCVDPISGPVDERREQEQAETGERHDEPLRIGGITARAR